MIRAAPDAGRQLALEPYSEPPAVIYERRGSIRRWDSSRGLARACEPASLRACKPAPESPVALVEPGSLQQVREWADQRLGGLQTMQWCVVRTTGARLGSVLRG